MPLNTRSTAALLVLPFLTVGSLSWSHAMPSTQPADPSFDRILQVAVDYINETKLPENLEPWHTNLPPCITRYDKTWKVTWELPPNVNGGTAIVTIDRPTLKVIKLVMEQ